MTINTETIRDAAEVLDTLTSALAVDHPLRTRAAARAKSCVSGLYSAADHIDAQTAEIAGARQTIERWKERCRAARQESVALKRDISDYIRIGNSNGAEIARLRYALRWTAAALQEACRRPTIITEKDQWRIDHETRTTGEILNAADAALSGESNG